MDVLNKSGLQTQISYIKGYVDAKVRAELSTIPKLSVTVVQELPTTDISDETIYLVPSQDSSTNNLYAEYIYVNNAWEKIGEQSGDVDFDSISNAAIESAWSTITGIDTSDTTLYATQTYVQNQVAGYLPLNTPVNGNIDISGQVSISNGSNAAINSLQRNTVYHVDDIVYSSYINAKYYLVCVTEGRTGTTLPDFSNIESGALINDGAAIWKIQTIAAKEDTTSGMPIGFEYFSINPNVPIGSLPLIGEEYSRDVYKDLWEWVQEQTGYLKTEAEWQALSTSNNGNVPFYSDGDGETTFRVPSLHCWVKGSDGNTQLVGSYLAAGLPNITGNFNPMAEGTTTSDGVFYNITSTQTGWGTGTGVDTDNCLVGFDASRSSGIYGNSSTVQPESIVGMWLVKAYGTVVKSVDISEEQYIEDRITALRAEIAQNNIMVAPTGCVQAFAGNTTPNGWLFCDGSAISRTTYAELYAVIGDMYGAGDGETTFNLPDLTDKFVQGNATSGTVKTAGLPNIAGEFNKVSGGGTLLNSVSAEISATGPLYISSQAEDNWLSSGGAGVCPRGFGFDASRSNPIYGNSTTVQPPAVTMRYIIKY